MRAFVNRWGGLAGLLVCIMALSGCALGRVEPGMTRDEVVARLGPPSRVVPLSSGTHQAWSFTAMIEHELTRSDKNRMDARLPTLRLSGLPPIVSSNTRLLVLGSFPGVASLARQQYYAHPQNQFWKILQAILPSSPRGICLDSYQNRSNWLLEQGLGVWDVYASCEREGSLDAAIRNAQVNDFASLQRDCPQLRVIAHNGGESFKHAKYTAGLL